MSWNHSDTPFFSACRTIPLTGYSSLRSGPAQARRNAAGRGRGLGTLLDGWPALVSYRSRAVLTYGQALRGRAATRRAAVAAWEPCSTAGLRLFLIAHGLFRPSA
ncbi:MAG: hypothetical protein AAGC70_18590, partial [Pseudomonadota bacterium]